MARQVSRFAEVIRMIWHHSAFGRRSTFQRWSVKFSNGGSLADSFRSGCCQVQNFRKSRIVAVFLMMSSLKLEKITQDSFVFKLARRQADI